MRRTPLLLSALLVIAAACTGSREPVADPGVSDLPGDPVRRVGCDPADPCTGSNCGEIPAGCPGVVATCRCDPGLECDRGTCRPIELPEADPVDPPRVDHPACKADAQHCCLADGTRVKPGGCSSIYPAGVKPATVRGEDGFCRPIRCFKRCLPATARIRTIAGERRVDSLVPGDRVWTLDDRGQRVPASLLRVEPSPLEGEHTLLAVRLADGRRAPSS